ncbi:MAG: DNA repair protein RecN [Firmicutes bacterium]|nr:DNA repair protein RecN [Bacillota bacterium]
MLSKITLKNVALIKKLEIDFCKGLNILSGETGAGKSILIDGIMLLLGGKYDKTILRHGTEDGFVEGVFECEGNKIADTLEEFGFEKEDILVATRKFNESGKNEIRINGRVSTTLTLQKITSKLVDIYGQNEYQSLAKSSSHLRIIDGFLTGEANKKLQIIRDNYSQITVINKSLKSIGDAKDRLRQADIIRFSLNEIAKANWIDESELDELVSRRKLLSSGEKVATVLSEAVNNLSEGESNALALLTTTKRAIGSISSLSSALENLYERIDSAVIEIDDIFVAIEQEANNLEFDPATLEKIERRIEVLRNIERKYGDFNEVERFVKDNTELLDNLEGGEEKYLKLQKQKNQLLADTYKISLEVRSEREKVAKNFEQKIIAELADLGMIGASFIVKFSDFTTLENTEKHLSSNGLDTLEFYFSANKGQPVKQLTKIISGGELSRFMLALKVVASSVEDIGTLIFDEIDTGIGGKIGQEVAKKLATIAKNHQVLCVTHLPQIAGMADNHYFIEKLETNGETETNVLLLDKKGTIDEISRLSGAKDITTTAFETARQMKEWSNEYKKIMR